MDPDIHLRRLLAPTLEEPFYRSLARNVRELIRPEKLPPLQVTSKPVMVKDIWGLYGHNRRSDLMSILIHCMVVVLLFTVASSPAVQQKVKETVHLVAPDMDLAPYLPQKPKPTPMGGGGGGGDRSPTPASKGRLPRVAPRQFTPPMAVVNNPNPKLIMEPTAGHSAGRETAQCEHGQLRRPAQ